MSWLTRTNWVTGNQPSAADFNAPGFDLRTWGGDVDAGGYSLLNVGGINGLFTRRSYDFTAQSPGGSLAIGSNTITLTPVPRGVNGADTGHYLYLSGGTGAAEKVLITGGTAVAGGASGTITFTCVNTHTGAWTVQSASKGIQEGVNAAAAAGGGAVTIEPGTFTMHATIKVPSGVHLIGSGIHTSILTRTEDYGDSFVLGSSSAGVTNIHFAQFTVRHEINYVAGAPPTVANPVTGNPNSAHFKVYGANTLTFDHVRMESLPYGIWFVGGAVIKVDTCQFDGLWDQVYSIAQRTMASVRIDYDATLGIPTYLTLVNNVFVGQPTISRTVTVNGNSFTAIETAGAKYHVWIRGGEVIDITGGAIGGANDSNVYINRNGTDPILQITIRGVYFDGGGTASVRIVNPSGANSPASNITIADNIMAGNNLTKNGIKVDSAGAGTTAWGINAVGNIITNHVSAAIIVEGSKGFFASGNIIRDWNSRNSYPTDSAGDQRGNSAIYFAAEADFFVVGPNQIGGGNAYEAFGSGSNGRRKVTVSDIGKTFRIHPSPGGELTGMFDDRGIAYSPQLRVTGVDWNEKFIFSGEATVPGAVSLNCVNGPETVLIPCEFRNSRSIFTFGPIGVPGVNYIATEGGANNAIAGTLANIPLTAGMAVTVKLAHTLQAGANTFNYNAGGALAIKSTRNPANNIATAYAATGYIMLVYDGTQWLDLSQ